MSFMKLTMASSLLFLKSWWSSFWISKDNFIGIQSISKRGGKRENGTIFVSCHLCIRQPAKIFLRRCLAYPSQLCKGSSMTPFLRLGEKSQATPMPSMPHMQEVEPGPPKPGTLCLRLCPNIILQPCGPVVSAQWPLAIGLS